MNDKKTDDQLSSNEDSADLTADKPAGAAVEVEELQKVIENTGVQSISIEDTLDQTVDHTNDATGVAEKVGDRADGEPTSIKDSLVQAVDKPYDASVASDELPDLDDKADVESLSNKDEFGTPDTRSSILPIPSPLEPDESLSRAFSDDERPLFLSTDSDKDLESSMILSGHYCEGHPSEECPGSPGEIEGSLTHFGAEIASPKPSDGLHLNLSPDRLKVLGYDAVMTPPKQTLHYSYTTADNVADELSNDIDQYDGPLFKKAGSRVIEVSTDFDVPPANSEENKQQVSLAPPELPQVLEEDKPPGLLEPPQLHTDLGKPQALFEQTDSSPQTTFEPPEPTSEASKLQEVYLAQPPFEEPTVETTTTAGEQNLAPEAEVAEPALEPACTEHGVDETKMVETEKERIECPDVASTPEAQVIGSNNAGMMENQGVPHGRGSAVQGGHENEENADPSPSVNDVPSQVTKDSKLGTNGDVGSTMSLSSQDSSIFGSDSKEVEKRCPDTSSVETFAEVEDRGFDMVPMDFVYDPASVDVEALLETATALVRNQMEKPAGIVPAILEAPVQAATATTPSTEISRAEVAAAKVKQSSDPTRPGKSADRKTKTVTPVSTPNKNQEPAQPPELQSKVFDLTDMGTKPAQRVKASKSAGTGEAVAEASTVDVKTKHTRKRGRRAESPVVQPQKRTRTRSGLRPRNDYTELGETTSDDDVDNGSDQETRSDSSAQTDTLTPSWSPLNFRTIITDFVYAGFPSLNFGTTIGSASKAIEAELSKMNSQISEDSELVAENKLYLRTVKERRRQAEAEKIARHREGLESRLRMRQLDYENRNRKKSREELEFEAMGNRKPVFASERVAKPDAKTCKFGEMCFLCDDRADEKVSKVDVLAPSFWPSAVKDFWIETSIDDEVETTRKNGRSSRRTNRRRGRQVNKERIMLMEMKHSLKFIEEYNKGYLS